MRSAFVALALCISAHVLEAARPTVGPADPVVPPPRERGVLPSQLEYTLVPFGGIGLTRVELAIGSGTLDESKQESGLGELVADYLLEGTTHSSAEEISRRMAELGPIRGDIRVTVSASETVISGEVLSASAPQLIRLIADTATSPAFPAEALERVKTNLLRRMASRTAQAPTIALTRVDELLFGDIAGARQASEDVIRAATTETVRRYWQDHYRPPSARLYVGGVFHRDRALSAIRDSFEHWKSTGTTTPERSPTEASMATEGSAIRVIDRPGATQSRIVVGFAVVDPVHPDHLVVEEMSVLMGSMQTSRIVANVRERHGYSYNISSQVHARRGSSKWLVLGDVAMDVTGAALREILAEIDGLRKEAPTVEELQRFQRFQRGLVLLGHSTVEGILSMERWQTVHGIPDDEAMIVSRLDKVTPADVHRIAQTYLGPDRARIVIVGDWSKIESQLREVGPTEVERR